MAVDTRNLESTCSPASAVPRGPSLKASPAYRWRIPISAVSILLTVALVMRFSTVHHWPVALHCALWSTGWLLLTLGVAIRLWAASCLGGKKSSELVRTGPYSLCRNPLYVGTLLIALSQAFFYESPWILPGLALPILLYAFGVVPAEEAKLRASLGDVYRRYCDEVPRWQPRFRTFEAGPAGIHAFSGSFRLELTRCAVWLCLPFLAAAISMLSTR